MNNEQNLLESIKTDSTKKAQLFVDKNIKCLISALGDLSIGDMTVSEVVSSWPIEEFIKKISENIYSETLKLESSAYLNEYIAETSIDVQVNGKFVKRLYVDRHKTIETALNDEDVKKHISRSRIYKKIYVPGSLINFITKRI